MTPILYHYILHVYRHDFSLGICLDFDIYFSYYNWYKEFSFTFVSVSGGSEEYHALLYKYKLTFICIRRRVDVARYRMICLVLHTWLVQNTSWAGGLHQFSVIRTLIAFKKQMNRLNKGERCTYQDIPLEQCSCHQNIWNFLRIMKWKGMPRGDVPLSEENSRKLV